MENIAFNEIISFDENSEFVGQIMGTENYGFDDLIVVKEGERTFVIPFVKDIFKQKDGKIYVIRKEYEGAKTDYENWYFNSFSWNVFST